MIQDYPIFSLSAFELSDLLRNKKISSEELVKAYIERAKQWNPKLNAIVKDRYEEAISDAKEADKLLASHPVSELPPLLGVPCTVKECFAYEGMPNSAGLVARKDVVADFNATVVQRLINSGAIPLGVTNVPELCMWTETFNRVHGRTNNAYDVRRIVGGSSGGEGSIISSGSSPFGIGSDVAGSIRLPAFFNGVFGHKPSSGIVPNSGQYPGIDSPYLTTGPICRKATDLMPILQLWAGSDGIDPVCKDGSVKSVEDVDVKKLKVYSIASNGIARPTKELRLAQAKVVEHFKSIGVEVEEIKLKELKKSFSIWSASLTTANGKNGFKKLMGISTFGVFFRMFPSMFRLSKFTFPALLLALVENFIFYTPKATRKNIARGEDLKNKLNDMLGEDAVLLYPSNTMICPKHHHPKLQWFSYLYCSIINIMELPSTQTPLGLSKKGLPLGIQVISGHGNDHVTIATGIHLEKEFGGWVDPEKRNS